MPHIKGLTSKDHIWKSGLFFMHSLSMIKICCDGLIALYIGTFQRAMSADCYPIGSDPLFICLR
jgi:hypothetical protein